MQESYLGKVIKHWNNTDVAFFATIVDEKENEVNFKGFWLNISCPNVYWVLSEDSITIPKDKLKNWSAMDMLGRKERK